MRTIQQLLLICLFIFSSNFIAKAQILIGDEGNDIDYTTPKEYEIGGITVGGIQFLDNNALILLSGIKVGERIKIPGEKITKAIDKLWEQGLFEDIVVSVSKIQGDLAFLKFTFKERPRLSKYAINGIRKGEADDIREKIKLVRGDVVTDNIIQRSVNQIKSFYADKGFLNAKVTVIQEKERTYSGETDNNTPNNGKKKKKKEVHTTTDSTASLIKKNDEKVKKDSIITNYVVLTFNVEKNTKVKIQKINLIGNQALSTRKLLSAFKETKERTKFTPFESIDTVATYIAKNVFKPHFDLGEALSNYVSNRCKFRIFKSSKFIKEDFEKDKEKLIEKYNENGYRDALVVKDTVYQVDNKSINVDLYINEGNKYYFRNIIWVGNTKYSSQQLNTILNINKGDVYDQSVLDSRLTYNQNGADVSSLYMDDGYLFFQANPVEVLVEKDSIDIEIRIVEGKQARINKVTVSGNSKTNDKVIIREIRTVPGELFSRSDVIRTQRELAQLKYFNAEKLGVQPKPNPVDGTVDIEYTVEETSSDQIELSGGWGSGMIVGTLGLSFNNFSTRNFFKKGAWRPLPSGDGQKFSIRAQSNGQYYQSYSASFTEPWLGGRKPIAFSVSSFYSVQAPSTSTYIKIFGASLGLSKRVKWPDDFFILSQGISFQNYNLKNYGSVFLFSNGTSNSLTYNISLSRNSVDQPIYPRSGSEVTIGVQLTPPYSLFSTTNYDSVSAQEKYKWIEYHKWTIKTSWFQNIIGDLVINTRAKFGFLGFYNSKIGMAPFERYYVGGDGLSGFALDGRELIGLRGYSNNSLTPMGHSGYIGGTIYNKYTFELRYPVSLNPSATIYLLGFFEAGNTWLTFKEFNPFNVYKSAGLGVRVFLPMFGVLGLDWGYGFDDVFNSPGANKGQFHFSINQSID